MQTDTLPRALDALDRYLAECDQLAEELEREREQDKRVDEAADNERAEVRKLVQQIIIKARDRMSESCDLAEALDTFTEFTDEILEAL